MGETRLRAVDGLRACAVLAVVGHHTALIPYNIGARGVELFFVISGFCLSLPMLVRTNAELPAAFDWRRFSLGRIVRIVPPYYVALALFVLLASTSFGVPSVLSPPTRYEWLLDALFLTDHAPAYNASFWTLGVEARWYLAFPAMLLLYVASKRFFALFALACYGVSALWDSPFDIGILPCFMLGIVAADLYVRGRAGSWQFLPAGIVLAVLAAAVDRTENPADPVWHFAAFFLVLAGVGFAAKALSWRPLVFVGAASYSVYLVHQPLVMWLSNFPMPWAVRAAIGVAAGIVFWRVVEVPSLALAASLRKRASGVTMQAAA